MNTGEPKLIPLDRLGTWWVGWSACLVVCGALLALSGWQSRGLFAYLCLAAGSYLIPFGLVGILTGIGLRRGQPWALRACRPLAILHAFNGPVGMGVAFVTFMALHRPRRPLPSGPTLDEMRAVLRAGMSREAFFDALDDIAIARGLRLRAGATPDQVGIPVAEGGELLCFLGERGLEHVEYGGDAFLEVEPTSPT